jgi:RNA polymerase sigma-70 factor (family 1)
MMPDVEFSEHSDEELLALLKSGCEEAFDCLYYRYRNKLFNIAYNRLRSKDVCEELIQDIFVNLWQRHQDLQIHGNLAAYLCTSVKYAVLDHIRAQKSKERYVSEMLASAAKSLSSTDEALRSEELKFYLSKSIQALPEKCREVFILSRFEDNSVQEIAKKLNISPDTAKYHISTALKKLRVTLKHLHNFLL